MIAMGRSMRESSRIPDTEALTASMSNEQKAKSNAPAAVRKRVGRAAEKRGGELWARCPECRMPVKDAELFKHLLNCPGAEVRQAEWAAQQAAVAVQAPPETQP